MRGVPSMSMSTGVPWGPGVHTMTMAPARSARSRHHATGIHWRGCTEQYCWSSDTRPSNLTAILGASVAQLLSTVLQFGKRPLVQRASAAPLKRARSAVS
eukprot:9125-Heterococcus_DN1.PRE.1